MNHIAEQSLEAYVRRPQTLDATAQNEIGEHLKTCEACRIIAGYLRDFYAELDRRRHEPVPRLEAFAKQLFPLPGTISLQPLLLPPERSHASDEYTLVLAARSPRPAEQRFQTVVTLASEQKDVLLRVLCDHESKTFRLFALAEDRRKGAHALISFPALGLEVLADAKGQATFALDKKGTPEDWKQIKCVLRMPLTAVHVRTGEIGQGAGGDGIGSSPFGGLRIIEAERLKAPLRAPLRTNSSESSLTILVDDYEISLARSADTLTFIVQPIEPDAQPSSLAALEGTASGLLFVPLQNGRGTCPLPEATQDLSIRFYSY
ncbi:MAG: hypothetical protein ACREOO_28675 [bacterium]